MKQITIELTDTEHRVFQLFTADPVEWVSNAAKERARIAIDEIVNVVVQKCLAEQMQIPSTREDMVALAIEKGWVYKPQTNPTLA